MKNIFLRKISDLKYNYGKEASDYFRINNKCEICSESRIACLTIHHVNGKKENKFQTLCFNCHMIKHGTAFTTEDMLDLEEKRKEKIEKLRFRNRYIIGLNKEGMSYRKLAKRFKLSHKRISDIINGKTLA